MSKQQTWGEWFFGSSTAAKDDQPLESSNDSITGKSSAPPRQTQPSPYGPYVRTGRGGAGNYTWQSDVTKATTQPDVESRKPSLLTEQVDEAASMEQHDTEVALRNQRQKDPSPYVRVGRGFIDRKDLETSAVNASETISNPLQRSNVTSEPTRPVYRGRGGAGNYAAAVQVNEIVRAQKDAEDKVAADERRERVIEDVDNAIPAPPGVWLGAQGRSSNASTESV